MIKVKNILENTLFEASLSGYCYNHGGFKIEFEKDGEIFSLELNNFWFDSKEVWVDLVKKYGKGTEPEETIRAFILTEQMWVKGSIVLKVDYFEKDNTVRITFKNSKQLNISLNINEEYDEFALSLLKGNIYILEVKNNVVLHNCLVPPSKP